jgi:hypothetical protein
MIDSNPSSNLAAKVSVESGTLDYKLETSSLGCRCLARVRLS